MPRLPLGAPGIYRVPDEPIRALTGVRMDVCGFVGVAPRGPAREPLFLAKWAPRPCSAGQTVTQSVPVPVESWSAYQRLYGGFEGPGLLPYAVASFFDNGGRRAYIVRIVHQYLLPDGSPDTASNQAGIARGMLSGVRGAGGRRLWLCARNEGAWGNALKARLSFRTRVLALAPTDFFSNRIRLPIGTDIVAGAALRIALGSGVRVIRRVTNLVEQWTASGARELWASLDAPTAGAVSGAEVVEGYLEIDDGVNPTEVHDRVGLSANHPRWLAAVLVNESSLFYPSHDPDLPAGDPLADWLDSDLEPDVNLNPCSTLPFSCGANRYADIVPEDFFGPEWVPGNECSGKGIHALGETPDLSLLVVPDLYSPKPLAQIEKITEDPAMAGAEFQECSEPVKPAPQGPPAEDLTGLRLDPEQDLDAIADLQSRVVALADQLQSFIALLDAPPRLSQRRLLYWRAKFTSAYAAGYHPWLKVSRPEDARNALIEINPAAAAAGIIAQTEIQFGVPYGPANALAVQIVDVADRVSPARHDELHQNAINVYLLERDGVRLSAARTLALDPTWRQLSVRRLVTMIRRVLERQMQWTVFEPNNRTLRAQISGMLDAFLRQLFRANAFSGASENEAFFVRCDDQLNTPAVEDQGGLIAQVGVAPAEPLEFIVLQIARGADAALTVEG